MRRLLVSAAAAVGTAVFGIPLAFAPSDLPPAAPASGADIAPVILAAYQRAADTCRGLRWELLAGIGQVESGHGTSGGATAAPDGTVAPPILGPPLDGTGAGGNITPMPAGRWAGRWGLTGQWLHAVGPMQFLPATFEAWAVDGDGDGARDPHDADDASATAAAYLCGPAGVFTDERSALRRYNPSDAYIEMVLAWAERYATAPPLTVPDRVDVGTLLAHPNVKIYADGRADLQAGRVDDRVVAVLLALATDHTISVTSLVTGHSRCAVTGQRHDRDCVVSNHHLGRAADLAVLDGMPVSARHPEVATLMRQLASPGGHLSPDEIGGPIDTGEAGVFTDASHSDHLHLGWDP